MRLKNFILCLLLCIASASAKDVITKIDGTKLDAKVEEIIETLIKYRKASNPTGPIYSIAIESVASIQYENGEKETFYETHSISEGQTSNSSMFSDEDLKQMSNYEDPKEMSLYVSDTELLRMVPGNSVTDLVNKSKLYRKIGLVGGVSLFTVSLVGGLCLWGCWSWDTGDFGACGAIIGAGMLVGAGWCIGFNLKAKSLMKKARSIPTFSTILIENEILQFGNNSLTAGINIMGNRMVNSHSLGLSLGLNF